MTFVKDCENSLTYLLRKSHIGDQKTRCRPAELRPWLSLTNQGSAWGKLLPPHQWDGDRENYPSSCEDLHMCEHVTQICKFWLSFKGWVFTPAPKSGRQTLVSHKTSWEYPEGVCSSEVAEGGTTSALSYSVYLLDNITAKGKQARSAQEAKLPPQKNYIGTGSNHIKRQLISGLQCCI